MSNVYTRQRLIDLNKQAGKMAAGSMWRVSKRLVLNQQRSHFFRWRNYCKQVAGAHAQRSKHVALKHKRLVALKHTQAITSRRSATILALSFGLWKHKVVAIASLCNVIMSNQHTLQKFSRLIRRTVMKAYLRKMRNITAISSRQHGILCRATGYIRRSVLSRSFEKWVASTKQQFVAIKNIVSLFQKTFSTQCWVVVCKAFVRWKDLLQMTEHLIRSDHIFRLAQTLKTLEKCLMRAHLRFKRHHFQVMRHNTRLKGGIAKLLRLSRTTDMRRYFHKICHHDRLCKGVAKLLRLLQTTVMRHNFQVMRHKGVANARSRNGAAKLLQLSRTFAIKALFVRWQMVWRNNRIHLLVRAIDTMVHAEQSACKACIRKCLENWKRGISIQNIHAREFVHVLGKVQALGQKSNLFRSFSKWTAHVSSVLVCQKLQSRLFIWTIRSYFRTWLSLSKCYQRLWNGMQILNTKRRFLNAKSVQKHFGTWLKTTIIRRRYTLGAGWFVRCLTSRNSAVVLRRFCQWKQSTSFQRWNHSTQRHLLTLVGRNMNTHARRNFSRAFCRWKRIAWHLSSKIILRDSVLRTHFTSKQFYYEVKKREMFHRWKCKARDQTAIDALKLQHGIAQSGFAKKISELEKWAVKHHEEAARLQNDHSKSLSALKSEHNVARSCLVGKIASLQDENFVYKAERDAWKSRCGLNDVKVQASTLQLQRYQSKLRSLKAEQERERLSHSKACAGVGTCGPCCSYFVRLPAASCGPPEARSPLQSQRQKDAQKENSHTNMAGHGTPCNCSDCALSVCDVAAGGRKTSFK
jgi:hypothetical protein